MERVAQTVLDRGRGVILGLAVGDALAGPLEFLSAEEISARHGSPVDEFIGGGWLELAPGEGTDDTAMTLALARSLATQAGYDPVRALDGYLDWYRTDPKDVGTTIRAALSAAAEGRSTAEATEAHHRETGRSAGNGSLMRCAPMALRYLRQPQQRTRAAREDSKLTHYDDHAADACAWLCDAIVALIGGAGPGELAAPPRLERERAVSRNGAASIADGPAAGYVGTALVVATAALTTATSFEEGLVWVANLGGDADTNAAVAGALLGARFGAEAIPKRWLDGLAVCDEATALAEQLIELAHRQAMTSGRGTC